MTVQLEFRLNGEVPVQLFTIKARKFVGLAVLLFFTIPFGLSVTGCGHKAASVVYCNSHDTGPVVGQVATIQLEPSLAIVGESLNYGQIGSALSATAYDCKGSVVQAGALTFGTTDNNFADVNPATGQACGGTWNRNSSGGVPNFTTCTPPATASNGVLAYITVSASGVSSNALPIYIHPVVTSIVFGKGANCTTDPDTTCYPPSPTTVVTANYYDGTSCISQGLNGQIAARVFAGTTNITSTAGHINWGTEGAANIVSIDQNGVVTANQPGSVSITGQLSNSSSANSIGFASTCPPVSISLSAVGQSSSNFSVALRNTQPITATALDKNNHPITGLLFEYNSTLPQNIPGGDTVQPIFPGTAVITAVCQPSICNPAPYSQIGYLGNGKPITSNGLTITATGTSSTLLYVASTSSQYVLPIDFSTGVNQAAFKLPYVPNSMVMTQDGGELFFGSPQGLMTVTTSANQVGSTNTLLPGTVISVSPSGGTVVITDPLRQTITLTSGSSGAATSFGGIATHAAWSPDGQTVYITTTAGNILTYSQYTNWQSTPIATVTPGVNPSSDTTYNDVTVLSPSVGAYFAGNVSTDGRTYCPYSTKAVGTAVPPTEVNIFSPLADTSSTAHIDRINATTDGKHVLGASLATGFSDIFLASTPGICTLIPNTAGATEATPVTFTSATRVFTFTGITPDAPLADPLANRYVGIIGVTPSSNSAIAFVTYTGTGSKLPYYLPVSTGNAGTLNYFPLTGGAIAPVVGVFSSDDSIFYVGTSGDNKIHLLTITYPTTGAPVITDSSQITPALINATGTGIATPNLIAQHPKATKS